MTSLKRLTKANGLVANTMSLLLAFLICLTTVNIEKCTALRFTPAIEINAVRDEYLNLEQSLWQHLNRSPNNRNTEQQMRKIIDSHRKLINEHMNSTWPMGKYEILNHYEWSILERDLQQIETLFNAFKLLLNSEENSVELTRSHDLENLMDNILRNDKTFSMDRIFQDIELIMVKQTMYYRAMMVSASLNYMFIM